VRTFLMTFVLLASPALGADPAPPATDAGATPDATQPETSPAPADRGSADPEQPPPSIAPSADAPSAEADSGGLRFRVGVHAGPTIPMSRLRPGVRPRAELVLSGRIQSVELGVFATGAMAGLRQSGEGTDPQLAAGTYTWELRQREISLAMGAFVRLGELAVGLHPELLVAPQWYLLRTRSDGESGGEPFGQSEESWSAAGIMVATGLSRQLGPGEIVGRVEWTMAPMKSVQTGDSHLSSIAPTLGYRLVF